mgnify:CR=1 FL=1
MKGLFTSKKEDTDDIVTSDIERYRLDIMENEIPLSECKTQEDLNAFVSYKVKYITATSVLTVLILTKLGYTKLVPFFFVWFYSMFEI